jgi:phospholipid/cholesterol/gamma-HCH transport system substrate-binding protein
VENTIKVGIFMTLALGVLAYLILRAEQVRLFEPRGRRVVAQFTSVAGLDDQSAVRIAGVRVGRVDGIDLRGRQAMVSIVLEDEVPLTRGTYAQIKNLGLLGDKYVELVPGPGDAAALGEGAVIPGQPATGIDEVLSSVGGLGGSLQEVAAQLSGRAPPDGPLGRLVINLETTSAQIRDLVASNREQLRGTIDNFEEVSATLARELPKLAEELNTVLAEVHAVLLENRVALHGGLQNVESLTTDLQTSVDNLNDITGKLARGEGTMGKLINSDKAHEELVGALESVQSGVEGLTQSLGKVNKIELDLAMQGWYLAEREDAHGELQVDVDPQSGRLYRIAVADDPNGRRRSKTQTVTVTLPDGRVEQEVVRTDTVEDRTTLSALFGYRGGEHYKLWAGLVESTFGVMADYQPTPRWNLTMQAFDFSRQIEGGDERAHLRLSFAFRPRDHFYLLGGYDDPLSRDNDSLFLGAGIRWRDDDLKYLLGALPRY